MYTLLRHPLFVVAWLLWIAQPPYASAQEIDASLAQYLQTISHYTNIKYSAKSYLRKSTLRAASSRETLKNFVLAQAFEAKIDFAHNYFYIDESIYPSDLDGSIHRVTSWHQGYLREYVDDTSPGLKGGVKAADGVIRERELESGDLPTGPRVALGFGITESVGIGRDLPDLVLHLPAETIAKNRYVIKNVFGWSESFGSAYDLEFTLDPEHGYLPVSFTFWDRTFGERSSRNKLTACTVSQFTKVDGLWCPVDMIYSSFRNNEESNGYRVVLSKEKLHFNFAAKASDFVLEFPARKTYLDVGKKLLYQPSKAPLSIADSFAQSSAMAHNQPVTHSQTLQNILFAYPLAVFSLSVLTVIALKARAWYRRPL